MNDATKELLVADGLPEHVAGAVVFWSSRGDVDDYDALRDAWDGEHLPKDLLLEPPSPCVAVHRAVLVACRGNSQRFHRKAAGGWIVVEQNDGDDGTDATFDVEAKFGVNAVGRLTGDVGNPLWPEVSAEFRRQLDTVSGTDLNAWLAGKVMRHLHAVTLRDSGGFYYVSRDRLREWRRIRIVLDSCTPHAIGQITAVRNDADTVAAVLAALQDEAAAFVVGVQDDLDSDDRDFGVRAWQTRQKRCRDMVAKLGSFKSILGDALDSVVEQIEAVEAETVAAALAAMNEED